MTKRYRKPHQVRRRKPAKRKARRSLPGKRAVLVLFAFLVLGGSAYVLLFLDKLQLQGIEAQGTNRVDKEQLLEEVRDRVGRQVGPWRSESMLVLDTEGTARELQELHPQIASASLDRTFFERSLTVKVQERQEVAVWCQGGQGCFLVDQAGIAFHEGRKDTLPLLVLDAEGGLGAGVIDPALLGHVLALRFPFASSPALQGVDITRIEVVSPRRVNAVTSEGWSIYFDPSSAQEWQVTKLRAVLEEQIPPAERTTLQYIDLRFGDQAYYQ